MSVQILDYKRRFQRGIGSSPFTSLGLEWCDRCKTETDCDTQAEHLGTVYVYRRNCNRCGKVLKRGVYENVPLICNRPLPAAALEWTTRPGKDRSK